MPRRKTDTLNPVISKPLTARQKKFAEEIVLGRCSNTEAARRAGYAESSAKVRASELLDVGKFPHVAAYISDLHREMAQKYEVTYERHISELGKIREAALKKGAFSAANNAEVARGKAAGLYVEQKIIRTGKLDDMSKEEMETELKKILEEYSPLLQDVTTDDVKEKVKEKRLPRLKKLN